MRNWQRKTPGNYFQLMYLEYPWQLTLTGWSRVIDILSRAVQWILGVIGVCHETWAFRTSCKFLFCINHGHYPRTMVYIITKCLKITTFGNISCSCIWNGYKRWWHKDKDDEYSINPRREIALVGCNVSTGLTSIPLMSWQ